LSLFFLLTIKKKYVIRKLNFNRETKGLYIV